MTGDSDITTKIQIVGLVLAIIILVGGISIPTVPRLEQDMQRVLAIFFSTLILWLTKPVPYEISSILSVGLLFALSVVDSFRDAVIGYASSLVFFLLVLLLLGNAISEVNFDERFAKRLSGENTPRDTVRSLSINLVVLAFVMPSALARAVTFLPVIRRVAERYNLPSDSDFELASFLILGQVNPLASMALMTGGGMAITTAELIRSSIRPISWVEWGKFMIPPALVLYGLSAFTAEYVFSVRNSITTTSIDQTKASTPPGTNQHSQSLNRDQKIVAIVMVGTLISWVIGSFIGIPTILPAIGAVTVLAFPRIRIITTEDIRDVSWGILFLIGAMFSILEAMETTGALTVIVDQITSILPFSMLTHWQTIGTLLMLAALLRIFFSTGSAAIVVVLPIILEIGRTLQVNELYLAFSVLILIGATAFLPFNTTTVLLSFDQGPLNVKEIFVFALFTTIYATFVIFLSWLFYWPLLS